MAFYHMDPWGEERADLRAGIIASVIANVNRGRRSTRRFKPADFMPQFTRTRPRQETGEMIRNITRVIRQHNAALAHKQKMLEADK
jgi:hypothetical protein